MSSRSDEKDGRRREREAAEQAEAQRLRRSRRLRTALGAVVAALAIAGVAVAALGGTADDGTKDLKAAQAAGCTFREFRDEGNTHLPSARSTFDGYKTNPPTSGTHRPPPAAADGVYLPGNSPAKENWVHTLEHGRVILMYRTGTADRAQDPLRSLMDEPVNDQPSGYKTVLMENNTKMPFAVAAVSWTRYVGCGEVSEQTIDVLRDFRSAYVDHAPESEIPWPSQ